MIGKATQHFVEFSFHGSTGLPPLVSPESGLHVQLGTVLPLAPLPMIELAVCGPRVSGGQPHAAACLDLAARGRSSSESSESPPARAAALRTSAWSITTWRL